MGKEYHVYNFGVNGATALKKGDNPYWKLEEYQMALKWKPDIVILMLGCNDSKKYQWDEEAFFTDFAEMARSFTDLPSEPKLFVMQPPPLYKDGEFEMQSACINRRLTTMF